MFVLSDHLRAHLPANGQFDALMRVDGQEFRAHKNRRTVRAVIGGRTYFIKTHGATAWREILKNALRGRWPTLTALTEWNAIHRLQALNVSTTPAVGMGVRGRFPHRLESFIVTEELANMIHLSDLPECIRRFPPPQQARLQRRLVRELASIARMLHTSGLNHRDFYLCHFMVRDRNWSQWSPSDETTVHLIDLHRLQIRNRTPRRWAIKDISGLLFSALDAGLTSRDYLRFLAAYWNQPWRERWRASRRWRRAVVRRAVSLYRSEHGRWPQLPAAVASFA